MFDKAGFRTSGLRNVPLEEALKGIRAAGYQTVEFCMEHPQASGAYVQMARDMGLEISAVSYHGKRDPFPLRMDMCRSTVELAASCRVERVLFGSPATDPEGFRMELQEVFPLARDSGLLPCWETEPDTVLDSLKEAFELILPLGSQAGLNIDAGHLHLQGSCTAESIGALAERIHHVHVEGMSQGRHVHLVPGDGDLDWKALLTGLKAAGYSDSLTIDLFDLPVDWRGFITRARFALSGIIAYYQDIL